MTYQHILLFMLSVLGAIIIAQVALFIFSPLYHFSLSAQRNPLDQLSKCFLAIVLKVFSVLLLLSFSLVLYPICLATEIVLSEFGPWPGMSMYHVYVLVVWLGLSILCLSIWWKEKTLLNKKVLNEVDLSDLGKSYFRNNDEGLDVITRGVRVLVKNTSNLEAYTYGALLLRPRIVISIPLLSESWAGPFRSVLLHELTHIDRRDNLFGLMVCLLEQVFNFVLKVFFTPLLLLTRLPLLRFLNIVIQIVLNQFLNTWRLGMSFIKATNRSSEFFADCESYGTNPPVYLILAIYDFTRGKLGHYHKRWAESVARGVINEFVHKEDFKPKSWWEAVRGFFSLDNLSKDHPDVSERIFWAALYSERLYMNQEKSLDQKTPVYPKYIVATALILPVLFFVGQKFQESYSSKFYNSELDVYEEFLKEDIRQRLRWKK
jgi:Zn-dependent protease with chaperone function